MGFTAMYARGEESKAKLDMRRKDQKRTYEIRITPQKIKETVSRGISVYDVYEYILRYHKSVKFTFVKA
jgi:hypothetical protein